MSQKFTKGFKIQAVEKALNRSPEITLVEISETLGVSRSALQRWITQSRNYPLADIPHTYYPYPEYRISYCAPNSFNNAV